MPYTFGPSFSCPAFSVNPSRRSRIVSVLSLVLAVLNYAAEAGNGARAQRIGGGMTCEESVGLLTE